MSKDLKLFYFGTLAPAALLMAFFPLIALILLAIYICVNFAYISTRPTTVSYARRQLDLNLSSFRLYTLLGVFVMTPFNSLLIGALGAALAGYWLWRAYTTIRDYEAAEAAAQDDSDDNDDGDDDASAAP